MQKIYFLFITVLICSTASAQTKQTFFLPASAEYRYLSLSEKQNDALLPVTHQPDAAAATSSWVQVLDSVYLWKWDTLSIDWSIQAYRKSIDIVYDVNYNKTSELIRQWIANAWVDRIKHLYTYDATNNEIEETDLFYANSSWGNLFRLASTYDGNNNKTEYLLQSWVSTAWGDQERYLYTYDGNNNNTELIAQSWTGSVWENYDRFLYVYNVNNELVSHTAQTWSGTAWEDLHQGTYTNDGNGNNTGYIELEWDGSTWVNNMQYTATFDGNNNLTGKTYQIWNGSAWVNSRETRYTYDVNDFMQSFVDIDYKSDGITIDNGDSTYYYFNVVAGIANHESAGTKMQVYPNPGSGSLTIDALLAAPGIVKAELRNTSGQLVYSCTEKTLGSTYHKSITTNLVQGLYYLTLYSDEGRITKKIEIVN